MRRTSLAVLTLLLLPASAVAQGDDPNVKTTVTDIQYRISYSQQIPGNCAVLGFSQWEASTFKGWEATRTGVLYKGATTLSTFPVSAPPLYDDQLAYGGNVVSPPNGSHWVLIGDGSFRAGPPPAQAECEAMLARSRELVPDGKVTTSFRRTTACATKFAKLTAAQKAVRKAKGKKARGKARKKLAKAKQAFGKDCSK